MVADEAIVAENELIEEEPSFSDSEYDFEDEISDEELVGDILHEKPSLDEYESCCVILFGIPKVGDDRLPKLKSVLGKLFGRTEGKIADYYAMNEDGSTKGYCFLVYRTSENAENATAVFDGYILDKNHKFTANILTDIHKFREIDMTWQPPEREVYKDFGNPWSWLQNDKCYDQFALHYDKDISVNAKGSGAPSVAIFEYRKGSEPVILQDREFWTESVFKWSPNGTYFASLHGKGVVLWIGSKFERYKRYEHVNVMMIDFSPCENFLVTYAPPENRWSDDKTSLRIFNVKTGEIKCSFSLLDLLKHYQLPSWPFFLWSYDEKFIVCQKPGGNGLLLLETQNFKPYNKENIIIDGLRSFKWSPTRPYLAYYCEERTNDNAPAEIGIMELPSKIKLRAQRIFSVSEADLFWNKNGDRLAVHTERYQKKNVKTTECGEEVKYMKPSSHIEIFDARGKDVSILSMLLSEPYISFGWEPVGDKFCILVGWQHKSTPLIYYLDTTKHTPQLISKFEQTDRYNKVSWAPVGGWLVVHSACSSSGNIMFIDSNGPEPTRTNIVEFPGFDKCSWDPTGRYFTASCTIAGGKGDTGYRIYTFQGSELWRKPIDRLIRLKWRPRLPVKLSDDVVKMVKKSLKTISAKFEEEDKLERGKATKEVIEKRKKMMDSFKQIAEVLLDRYSKEAELRKQLRGAIDYKKQNDDLVNETITVLHSSEKTLLKDSTDKD